MALWKARHRLPPSSEERAEEHEHQRDQRELAQRGDRLRERRDGMSCCLVEEGKQEDPEHAAGTERAARRPGFWTLKWVRL